MGETLAQYKELFFSKLQVEEIKDGSESGEGYFATFALIFVIEVWLKQDSSSENAPTH